MKTGLRKIGTSVLSVVASFSLFICNPMAAVADSTVTSVYTGEQISASDAETRPIAVMMPTDKAAQPSYGIGRASILYEIMEEGNISRQLAVIDNWQDLSRIGNIRSCREYYIHIATEWDPILIHFGGVVYMKNRITQPDINNLSGVAMYGVGGKAPGSGQFFRSSDRKNPHNAYISAEGIKKAAASLGYSLTNRPEYYNSTHFAFAAPDMPNTLDQYATSSVASKIDLSNVFGYTKTSFDYDPVSGQYLKNIHGGPHKDAISGNQLTFSNVVIQITPWKKVDKKGYLSFDVVGSGEGYFCTEGRAIHCTWTKTADHSPTKYYDDFGQEIVFNQGHTYIAIAQEGKTPTFG